MLRGAVGIVVAIGLFLGMCTPAGAFDGSRKGFILGVGVGPGLTSYTVDLQWSPPYDQFFQSGTTDRENKAGVATDFKIGYAPNEQLQIFWSSRVSWFSSESVTVANGLGGAGVSYYLIPQGPSAYFTGTIGFSSWATPFEKGSEASYGFGIAAGAGYEFARHWSVEGVVGYSNPSDSSDVGDATVNAISARVTINVLGY